MNPHKHIKAPYQFLLRNMVIREDIANILNLFFSKIIEVIIWYNGRNETFWMSDQSFSQGYSTSQLYTF